MRTPEEAARLASGVTVETPSGVGTISPKVIQWGERRILSHAVMPGIDKEEALVCLAADLAEARAALEVETGWRCQASDAYRDSTRRHADTESKLAEARAEVAALREVAGLVREWQAAKRASTCSPKAGFTQSWLDLKVANDEREAIESRLLATTLPEVSRG